MPFSLGFLPPASQCRWCLFSQGHHLLWWLQGHWAHRVLPASTPHFIATGVVRDYLSHAGTSPRAPVIVGLEPLSVLGTCPCTAGAEDPGGHFVEMRDLLGDNIALTQHFESAASYFPTVLPSSERLLLREVSSLSSWVYCFLIYLAVLVQDQTIRDCLVYARLIVWEALCHGGGAGWITTVFSGSRQR